MMDPSSEIGSGKMDPWVGWLNAHILLKEAEAMIGR